MDLTNIVTLNIRILGFYYAADATFQNSLGGFAGENEIVMLHAYPAVSNFAQIVCLLVTYLRPFFSCTTPILVLDHLEVDLRYISANHTSTTSIDDGAVASSLILVLHKP